MKLIKLFLSVNKPHFGLELPAFFFVKVGKLFSHRFYDIYRVSKKKWDLCSGVILGR